MKILKIHTINIPTVIPGDKRTDKRTDKCMDKCTDKSMDKRTQKHMHGQIFTQYSGISSHSMGACIVFRWCF
jgi:hypothetical protein